VHCLSAALARRGFHPLYDRGQVMADLTVAIKLANGVRPEREAAGTPAHRVRTGGLVPHSVADAERDGVPGRSGRVLPRTAHLDRERRRPAGPVFCWAYSIGWSFTEREQAAIETVDRLALWQAATGAGGQARARTRSSPTSPACSAT
jgi:hypothetical protein